MEMHVPLNRPWLEVAVGDWGGYTNNAEAPPHLGQSFGCLQERAPTWARDCATCIQPLLS